jgi:hypothetical protein
VTLQIWFLGSVTHVTNSIKKCMMKYALDQYMNIIVARLMKGQFVCKFLVVPNTASLTTLVVISTSFLFYPCERASIFIQKDPGRALRLVRTLWIRGNSATPYGNINKIP